MGFRKIADAVVSIRYGNQGFKKHKTVGSLLEADENDPDKGLPYVLMLDKTFNPAGVPGGDDSVAISFYHPKEKGVKEPPAPQPSYRRAPSPGSSINDDDIPF